jgi:2-deoxy-D-gluconate 3-dehydrogenase
MTLFDLSGRVAVVTGGNGGIGLGVARGLAAAGATIVVAARNSEKAVVAVAALGGSSAFIGLDVADESSCRAVIEQTADRFGRLDILVNNAGTSIRSLPRLIRRPNGMPCSTPTCPAPFSVHRAPTR